MVPKVAGKGSSFKGAAAYYLHDKGKTTAERVVFAETLNLPTRDPDKAFKCMAWTAAHQAEIKARAGGSTKGRKLRDPVYTYSLSWAPDERPTRQDMVGAAKETLKVLGLEQHETILVSHRDEPHPHIHVIVNRVHPETGIAAKLSQDHLKLSRWAEGYERRQGLIRCEARVENNERRRQGEFVKERRNYRSGEFYRWRAARVNAAFAQRQDEERGLTEAQRDRRDALREDYEQRRDAAFRDATRNDWRTLYLHFRWEKQKLLYELDSPQERLDRLTTRDKDRLHGFERAHRTGFLSRVHKAAMVRQEKLAALEQSQQHRRVLFARKLQRRDIHSVGEIDAKYRKELDALKETERRERDDLRREHTRQSQEEARRITEGRDYADYREEKARSRLSRIAKLKDELTRPRSERLSGKFRDAAKESGRDSERGQDRGGSFRDNAEDIGSDRGSREGRDGGRDQDRDRGRERSIRRKPPGKPDEP